MRVRVGLLLFLLFGGAALNAMVAWGLWLRPVTYQMESWAPTESDKVWWRKYAPPGFAAEPGGVAEDYDFGRSRFLLYEHEADANNSLGNNVARWRAGWPLRTFEGAVWVDRQARVTYEQFMVRVPANWPGHPRPIPWRPLWSNFAINTAFYASVLWLCVTLLMLYRRMLRRRRGLCEKCAYPIGVSPVCTECGAAVLRRADT